MKKLSVVLASTFFVLASVAWGQSAPAPVVVQPSQTFQLTASAVALPGNKTTVAASIIGGTFQVSNNFALRSDNIVSASGAMNGYYGGFQYVLPSLSKKLNNVSQFDASSLQFYVTASAGVDHVGSQQHYSELLGGGVNYAPNGRFAFNIGELRYMKAPGFANNTAVFSTGIQVKLF